MDFKDVPPYDPRDSLEIHFPETEEGVTAAQRLWRDTSTGGNSRWPNGLYCLTDARDVPEWPLPDLTGFEQWEKDLMGRVVAIRLGGVSAETMKKIVEQFPEITSIRVISRI